MTTIPVSDAPALAPDALGRAAALVAPAMDAAVDHLSPELVTPIRHHLAGGGKRVRAALVLVSAAAAGGTEEAGIPGAVAIELVHNFSLLHDDIIDEDRDRRHRPTVWA
ncbi:MAG TPA: polyprenyl synthetase family protein, partial [Acidimicrobiales bacterium]